MDKREKKESPFSVALTRLLKEKGWGSGSKLAAAVGIQPGYVSELAAGRRKGEADKRVLIAKHFGLTYDDMLHLGQWIIEGNDPEQWKPPMRGSLAPEMPWIPAPGITRNIADPGGVEQKSLSEMLSNLPANQKYQEAKNVLVAGIGIPEDEADKLLMKHMGLPPDLAAILPENKQERFARIWEYACTEHQKLKKTAWPGDKERYLSRYVRGELDDVGLYLEAINWLNELFGAGGQPK